MKIGLDMGSTLVWPKERETVDKKSAAMFAQVAIATGDSFEKAVNQLKVLFIQTEELFLTIHKLKESQHPDTFPKASLTLLSAVVSTKRRQPSKELREIMERIGKAEPKIRNRQEYKNFEEYLERLGY